MRIASFWARGFRSLRNVPPLEGLGPFNVFYGPNGSGKSNLIAALDAWLRLIPIALRTTGMVPINWTGHGLTPEIQLSLMRGQLAYGADRAPLQPRDFSLHSPENRKITLGGKLVGGAFREVEIELYFDATAADRPTLTRYIRVDGVPLEEGAQLTRTQDELLDRLASVAWERKLSVIPVDRMPRIENASERPPAGEEPVAWYFRRGQLKDALFAAQNATSTQTLDALEVFRKFMAGEPLKRPPFRAVEDPHTGARDLRERLAPPLQKYDVSLDLAGLGIAQIYWILGQAMLSGARAIAIEEPEAHLHAPTTGLHLRSLLARLVEEEHIDQLFIATHSNLFDLDGSGFFDVRLENGETFVEKKPLDKIDEHLYEPGPTLHALEELLAFAPPDKVMFRRPDGSPVTAVEMIKMLRDADPVALDYLRNLHAAAVDVVGLRSRRGSAG